MNLKSLSCLLKWLQTDPPWCSELGCREQARQERVIQRRSSSSSIAAPDKEGRHGLIGDPRQLCLDYGDSDSDDMPLDGDGTLHPGSAWTSSWLKAKDKYVEN